MMMDDTPPTNCVLGEIARRGATSPFRPAIVSREDGQWRQLTYGELAASIEGWARILRGRAGDGGAVPPVVAIVTRHGLEACAAFLGAMRAGLLPCFLPYPTPKQDRALYWESQRAVLARLRPAVIISYAALLPELAAIAAPNTPLIDASAPGQPDAAPLPPLAKITADAAPILLQHSSGTTGLKKSVRLTHGQVRRQLRAYAAAIGMTADDRVISWLPLYHDMGLIAGFLLPLAHGGVLIAMDAFDWLARPAVLLEAATYFRSTFCWLPNFAFAHLVNTVEPLPALDLTAMRAFINCSEPCRDETMARFAAHFAGIGVRPAMLQTCYAMAETVFAVTQTARGQAPRVLTLDGAALAARGEVRLVPDGAPGARRVVSCGTPIDGTALRIAGSTGWWPRGGVAQVGEILIRSACAFDGYFLDPGATQAAFSDGWYRSGDMGFLFEGELFVTGRLKEMLIVNGRNFYAHDIEAIAGTVAGVKPGRAVAVAEPGAESEGAVVIAETDIEEPAARRALRRDIHAAIEGRLGLALRRVELVAPGRLVKTTSGKLSREENRKRFIVKAA